jgi:hypothetical protein
VASVAVRESARISVSKMGEYVVASPSRRRSIEREQKRPRDVIVARYREVYPAVVRYLAGHANAGDLAALADELEAMQAGSDWQAQDNALSAEALDAFVSMTSKLNLVNYTVSAGDFDPSSIQFRGVSISVRPEIRLTTNSGRTGALKLYLSKSHPLPPEAGLAAATLVHALLRDGLELLDSRSSDCMLVDVFAGRIYVAPSNFKARMRDVDAACEEISRAWATA